MKAEGSLVSRLISYDGVKVRVATHCLTPEQAQTYDGATELWQQLALVLRKKQPSLPSSAASRFWSAHQRFFRCLVTASKLPTLHSLLSEGLEEGKSVVVGLLGTGEAYTASETAAEKEGNGGGKEGVGASPQRPLRRLHPPVPVLQVRRVVRRLVAVVARSRWT